MGDKWIRKCYVLQEFRFRFLEVHYESGKKDSIESESGHPKGCPLSGAAPKARVDPLRSNAKGDSPSPLALTPCRLETWFGFGLPRCTTSEGANCTLLPPGRRKLHIRKLLLPFQTGSLTGDSRFGYAGERSAKYMLIFAHNFAML